MKQEKELKCAMCGEMFICEHVMVNVMYSQQLKVPHCLKCGYDAGLCEDQHGYQCAKCQQILPEFNPPELLDPNHKK